MGQDQWTRRQMLATTTLAATSAPFAIHAADKTGQRLAVVGTGAHRYECHHDWLMPPNGLTWGDTHGLCQDAAGRIYVAHTVGKESDRRDGVVVFDANGKLISSWGDRFQGGAHGIAFRREGNDEFLYHCDIRRNVVEKTDLQGNVVWQVEYPEAAPPYSQAKIKWKPTNVAFLPDGDLIIADGYGSNYLLRYSAIGEYKQTLGKTGTGLGEFRTPHGLWVDQRNTTPTLVVADRENHRLQQWNLQGECLRVITHPELERPCDVDTYQSLAVVADLEQKVLLYDENYQLVAQLGNQTDHWQSQLQSFRERSRADYIPGEFYTPHDAIFLHNGDILVAEWLPIGRISLLRRLS